MPEYLAPGVYIEEVSSGIKPIEGVATSTAGFVGLTERGPQYPKLITSQLAYQRWYGDPVPEQSYLGHAVEGFFSNGGQRCYIARIVSKDATLARLELGDFVVAAVGKGAWGNSVHISVEAATLASPDLFKVVLAYPTPADILEVYDNLSADPLSSANVVTILNGSSHLARAWWKGPPAPLAAAAAQPLQGGADGSAATVDDFKGDDKPIIPPLPIDPVEPLGRTQGLVGLGLVDDVAILAAPDEVRPGLGPVTDLVINQCELLKDRFAVVSTLQAQDQNENLRPPRDTTYGAFYFPWIEVYDSIFRQYRLIPPSGHVAGVMARTDIERGVHKAPANEVARGVAELEFPVPKGKQDLLNPRGVNCFRDFRPDGRGIRIWGARTMSSDPEWKYVNVRRLFIFVEESIEQGTQWVVFEPNYEETWARVVRNIENFLLTVWRNGALRGLTQEEAFFVKCDRTTMTEDDINNGRLICKIGMAPVRPAEFVIFRFQQKTIEARG